jgi:hypothetical protein
MTRLGLRGVSGLSGALLVAQAVVIAVIVAGSRTQVLLPVSLHSHGDVGMTLLGRLDLGVAVIVLCAFVGLARLVVIVPPLFSRYSSGAQGNRHTARWIEFAFSSSIVIFLIAQLNGVSDIGTLVLSYAITSGMTLFTVLQERSPRVIGGRMLPLWFGAAIGIVPWGVIAFHQVAALLSSNPPSVLLRVITLTTLAFSFALFLSHWREQRQASTAQASTAQTGPGGERSHIVLSLASTSVFAWLVVIGVIGVGNITF